MSVAVAASHKLCHVLEEDRDLAESVAPEIREQAAKECLAHEVSIPAGRWTGSEVLSAEDGIGLLVLSGLLIRLESSWNWPPSRRASSPNVVRPCLAMGKAGVGANRSNRDV